jgi:hypothetical protein
VRTLLARNRGLEAWHNRSCLVLVRTWLPIETTPIWLRLVTSFQLFALSYCYYSGLLSLIPAPPLLAMPQYNDDVFGTPSHLLSQPSRSAARKQASRQSLRPNGSSRGTPTSLTSALGGTDDGLVASGSSRFSLAHELAAALMPEPSAGSKLLAEEFGIDYDEGAEGIDEDADAPVMENKAIPVVQEDARTLQSDPAFANEDVDGLPVMASLGGSLAGELGESFEPDPTFGSPAPKRKTSHPRQHEQDPMDILANDLASTEKFITHLQRIDTDAHPPSSYSSKSASTLSASGSSVLGLEKLTSDVIRRLTDIARDREGQVRELLEAEREFRKIAGEIGGEDALATLDELDSMEELSDTPLRRDAVPRARKERRVDTVPEEHDWEAEMERRLQGDDGDETEREEVDDYGGGHSRQNSIVTLAPPSGPPTPAATLSELSALRTFTSSLVASLATISEQTQVNGAATADAGRKIRALKNKLGGWRAEWELAERSRVRIERWEAGLRDDSTPGTPGSPNPIVTPRSPARRRIDGRKIVEEQKLGFERALAEASMKIHVIMTTTTR